MRFEVRLKPDTPIARAIACDRSTI